MTANAFTQLVGCELPIQQAPIGFASAPPQLPAAVAAAGGHGMLAAVLAAGAAAARVGTRFLVADEAAAHPVHVDAVLSAGHDDTTLTEAFSVGAPRMAHRVLASALAVADALDAEHAAEMTVNGVCAQVPRFSAHNPSDDATGHVEAMALYAGQGAGAVRRREPARAIVADLARGVLDHEQVTSTTMQGSTR